MTKKQYIKPAAKIIAIDHQDIIAASDGQKMLNSSYGNGTVNFADGDDEITNSENIW